MAVRLEHIQEWIESATDMRIDGELLASLKDGQILCKLANSLNASIRMNKLKTTFHCKENITAFLQWAQRMDVPEQDLFEADVLLWGNDIEPVLRALSSLYNMFAEEIRASVRYTASMSQRSLRSNSGVSDGWSSDDSGLGDLHDDSNEEDIAESIFVREHRSSSKFAAFMRQIPEAHSPPSAPAPANKMAAFIAKTTVTPPVIITAPPSRKQSVESTPPSWKQSVESTPTQPTTGTQPSLRVEKVGENQASMNSVHMNKPRGPPKNQARTNSVTQGVSQPIKPTPLVTNSTPSVPPASIPQVRVNHTANDPRSNLAKLFMANAPKPPADEAEDEEMMTPPTSPKVHIPLQTPKSSPPPAATVTIKPPTPTPLVPKPQVDQTRRIPPPVPQSSPPSVTRTSATPTTSQTVNKLAGFLAKVPGSAAPTVPKAAPVSKLMAFMSSTKTMPVSLQQPVARQVVITTKSSTNIKKVFRCKRSTGSNNWIPGDKRGTYHPQARPKFNKEAARQKFMAIQAAIKAEQKARGADTKKAKTANVCVPGMLCYVPDEAETWILAEVESVDTRHKHVRVRLAHDGSMKTVDLKNNDVIRAVAGTQATEIDSLPLAIAHHEGVQDMRNLRFLNEPSILYNLKSRFEAAQPYTYSNDIVIAVNPYQWLGSLYNEQLHEKYLSKPRESLPPHVYATSTSAYKQMMTCNADVRNQSILVSGESGAGKTETTKILMHHLATVAGGRQDATIARVVDVNPLLESFGNAKTTRNDNSSRFGKFTQLQFDTKGRLQGGRCETYLLEKSRVVSFAEGERNYHIFYQLLSGLSSGDHDKLHLTPSHPYHFTGRVGEMQIDGMDDSVWLKKTEKALALIGLDDANRWTLYKVLAGILHLGEITFESKSENSSAVSNTKELNVVSSLLGLPTANIEKAFCNRTIASNRESVVVPLNCVEATENRDALAKSIYANLFEWLVQRINGAIAVESASTQIGVLDIFGFEDFKHNGFEQFCINYANEKLQQKFVKDVFSSVQEEYIREGLAWDHIQFSDNQDILTLIEGKLGIINLMNDHIRQPRGTEVALVNKFRTNAKENPSIAFAKVKQTQFTIKHYAGPVTYETIGFMEKHRDALMPDLLTLVQSSSVDFVVSLFPNDEPPSPPPVVEAEPMPSIIKAWNTRRKVATPEKSKEEEVVEKAFGGRRKALPPKTLGQQFKSSLGKLMETIEATNVHYVRCIKPNSIKSPTEFDKPMVVSQLRSAGVIDAIRISRAGYPSRLSAMELATRYATMFPPSMMNQSTVQETCASLMKTMGFNTPVEYQMGKTLVYFKSGALEELEALKSDFEYEQATVIQRIVLGFLARLRYNRQLKAIIKLQAFSRRALEQFYFWRMRHAITSVQVAFRFRRNHQAFLHQLEEQRQEEERLILEASGSIEPDYEPDTIISLPSKHTHTDWGEPSPRSSHSSTPLTSPEANTSEESFCSALRRVKQVQSDSIEFMEKSDQVLASNKRFESEILHLREQLANMAKENERLRMILKEHKINPDSNAPSASWL